VCLWECISKLGAFLPEPGLLVGVRAFSLSEQFFVDGGEPIRLIRFFVKAGISVGLASAPPRLWETATADVH